VMIIKTNTIGRMDLRLTLFPIFLGRAGPDEVDEHDYNYQQR
jgi:hypothetical protein